MDLPYTDMIDEECEGVEDVEGVPTAKRKKLSSSRGGGVHVITVPSSQVVRHEGGRGRERVRMKKGTFGTINRHHCNIVIILIFVRQSYMCMGKHRTVQH